MRRPLLSLAVPTFNRAGFLNDLLGSVEAELKRAPGLSSEIQVVVSDNASCDQTSELCATWARRLSGRLVYRRNDRNLGGPANLVWAMESGSAEYCMYIGDDDRLICGKLAEAVSFLRAHRWASLCLFAHRDFLSEQLARRPERHEARLSVSDAAAQYFFCAGIPAGSAIRLDLLRGAAAGLGAESLARTNWPQVVLAFLAAHMSSEPLPVAVRHGGLAHVSQHHDENTLYTAWTCWFTWIQGLVAAAELVDGSIGGGFLERACDDIFTERRLRYAVSKTLDHLLAIDPPVEVARFQTYLEATLPSIPAPYRLVAEVLLARGRTPRLFRMPVLLFDKLLARPRELLTSPRVALERVVAIRTLVRYRALHRRRLAEYRAGLSGGVRNYAEEGY